MVVDVGACFGQLDATHNGNFHENFVAAAVTTWSSDSFLHRIEKSTLKQQRRTLVYVCMCVCVYVLYACVYVCVVCV